MHRVAFRIYIILTYQKKKKACIFEVLSHLVGENDSVEFKIL